MTNTLQNAKKGDLVQIHFVVLEPKERAENLPEATRSVPYEGWIKGFLLDEIAKIGQTVHIETFIGRKFMGILTDINPIYDHNFGEPQPELNFVGLNAWKKLENKGKKQ
jgi:2-amino-4-ketopentanoate thiolase alpha subunit